MNGVLTKTARIFVPLLATLAIPSSSCLAWWGTGDYFIDGHTRYMWARTWHGPNALATPLRQYYIPRTPGSCGSDGYAGGNGCQNGEAAGVVGQYGGQPYPTAAVAGFDPVQFERLGRVPNEMDLTGGALPAGSPAAAPQR